MIYKSMQGKEVDMAKLISQNEMAVAVGNVRVNARGDELGPGGKILRKREDIIHNSLHRVPSQTNSRTIPPIETTIEISKEEVKEETITTKRSKVKND